MHPDIWLESVKAHQRELWREAERLALVRQAARTSRYVSPHQKHTGLVPQRILVPFDWSAPAYQALEEALALAIPSRARLTLLYVLHLPPRAAASAAPYMAVIEDSIRRALDTPLRRVHDAEVESRGLLVRGVPWRKIVDVAHTIQADRIVIGTHGRTGLARLFLGSVAARVQRHAPCPVQVIRLGDPVSVAVEWPQTPPPEAAAQEALCAADDAALHQY